MRRRSHGPNPWFIALLTCSGLFLVIGVLVLLDQSQAMRPAPVKVAKPRRVVKTSLPPPRVALLTELKEVHAEIEVVKERLTVLRSLGAFREQLSDTSETKLEIPDRRTVKETREAMQLKDRLSVLLAREAELEVAKGD